MNGNRDLTAGIGRVRPGAALTARWRASVRQWLAGVGAVALVAAGLSVTIGAGQAAAAPTVDMITVGSEPFGVAVGGGHVYVTNNGDGTVSVIDQATGTVTNTINVGTSPEGVAAGGGHVYVVNTGDDTVSVIDQTTNAVISTINVGGVPIAVAVGGGYVYVTNNVGDTVSVIDQTTNAVTNTINVGGEPFGVAVGGGHVYITNFGDDTVSVIDQTTNAVISTINVGLTPEGVAAGGGHVYVVNHGGDTVSVIDQTTNAVISTINVGTSPWGVAAGGGHVYVTNNVGDTVSVIDQTTNAVTNTINVGGEPFGVAVGGGHVYVANFGDDTVSVFDAVHQAQSMCPPNPFPDVSASNVHCKNIAWLKTQGITKPADGLYHPTSSVNRGSMVAFLFRLTQPGKTSPKCTAKPFPDVSTSNVFCGYIQWAKNSHIAFGYPNGKYGPTNVVTRGAMAAFLHRIATASAPTPKCTSKPYSDVQVGDTFCGVITWMANTGITYGVGGGKYGTTLPVTRQAMASFLRRLHDLP